MRLFCATVAIIALVSVPALAGGYEGEQELLQRQYQKQQQQQLAVGVGIGAGFAKASSSSGGNSIKNNIEGDKFPASSAASLGLTGGPCMGSSGIGFQGMSFGVSVGTAWTDVNCVRERRAREAGAVSKKAQKAILCENDDTRDAFKLVGEPCPQDVAEAALKDLKAATYWEHPTTGKVHRIPNTTVDIDGKPEVVAWRTIRLSSLPPG